MHTHLFTVWNLVCWIEWHGEGEKKVSSWSHVHVFWTEMIIGLFYYGNDLYNHWKRCGHENSHCQKIPEINWSGGLWGDGAFSKSQFVLEFWASVSEVKHSPSANCLYSIADCLYSSRPVTWIIKTDCIPVWKLSLVLLLFWLPRSTGNLPIDCIPPSKLKLRTQTQTEAKKSHRRRQLLVLNATSGSLRARRGSFNYLRIHWLDTHCLHLLLTFTTNTV